MFILKYTLNSNYNSLASSDLIAPTWISSDTNEIGFAKGSETIFSSIWSNQMVFYERDGLGWTGQSIFDTNGAIYANSAGFYVNFTGHVGISYLSGGDFGDFLVGGSNDDTVSGGGGNDMLEGGLGADSLTGGTGTNTASYDHSSAAVTVNLTTGINTGGDAEGDSLTLIQNLLGSTFADSLTGDGNANTLYGNGGSGGGDSLFGEGGNDRLVVIDTPALVDGGTGTDSLYVRGGGTVTLTDASFTAIEKVFVGDDTTLDMTGVTGGMVISSQSSTGHHATITGTNGNDFLKGGAGADILDGGGGTNTTSYAQSSSGVTVNLTTGVNTGGDAEGDTLSNISKLIGSAFQDSLTGDNFSNTLIGNSVYDSLYGMGGNDCLVVSETPVMVDGGTGTDIMIVTGSATFSSSSLIDIEKIYVRDYCYAGFEADTQAHTIVSRSTAGNGTAIYGSQGADRIYCGDGDDLIIGSAGNDKMFAGSGSDRFTYMTDMGLDFGRDNIYRFDVTYDRLDVAQLVDSFADVNIKSVHNGQDTQITLVSSTDPLEKIILHDVHASSLTADNFLIY